MSYNTQNYREQGGARDVIGGEIDIIPGGALKVAGQNVTNAIMRRVLVTVTSTQLLALFATPQTIVPAPGAGRALVFEGAVLHKPAGTAYAGIAAGEDLSFKYTDASGAAVAGAETTGFLDQATAQTRYARPATAASGVTDITPVANAPLVLHLLTGEITTGNSPLVVEVFYRDIAMVPA
ncbi:hypothetical protein [Falsiroseomonas sp.]|uniref:hypothetical protein n=1 Tax=Falsiroseomonas sp. TaxID=2870721 RepID=UPI00273642CE|nr:hypothetical protein [Falsiroseomonas sp.]MDP3417859.1 hypothetical protein [Falsiroseomonas sp.]